MLKELQKDKLYSPDVIPTHIFGQLSRDNIFLGNL